MPNRPYRLIADVLDDFEVPVEQRTPLTDATRQIVDQYRAQNPGQMRKYLTGDILPLPLASEFLKRPDSKIFDKEGKPIWNEPGDMDKLRTGFANIIGLQIVYSEEKLRSKARSKRTVEIDETQQDFVQEYNAKKRLYDQVPESVDASEEAEHSTESIEWAGEHPSQLKTSSEVASESLMAGSVAEDILWSPSDSSDKQDADATSFTQPAYYADTHFPIVLPHAPDSAREPRSYTIFGQLQATDKSYLPDIPPTPATTNQEKNLSVSDIPETTIEELFSLEHGEVKFQLSGEQCAKALRLTLLHVNSLKADLTLAAEQDMKIDCLARISRIIHSADDRMKE